MFQRASLLLSFASVALALSVGDLRVSLTYVAPSVRSIEDIILTAVVSNPTDTDLRVSAVNNILDTNPSQSFLVSKDGEDVLFTGARITPNLAADVNWVTIAAGSSFAVNHTVSKLYNFELHGTGTFSFSPIAIFQSSPTEDALFIDVDPVTVEVTTDVAFRSLVEHLTGSNSGNDPGERESHVNCNDGWKAGVLRDALVDGRARAGGAAYDVRANPNSDAWNRFFGGGISHDEVWWRFDLVAGDLPSSGIRQLYCNQDPAGICAGANAYVLLVTSGSTIVSSDAYFCEHFFNLPNTQEFCSWNINDINSSRGSVMLHELSHATSATTDYLYNCGPVQGLPPQQKRLNADNYECMALWVFRTWNC